MAPAASKGWLRCLGKMSYRDAKAGAENGGLWGSALTGRGPEWGFLSSRASLTLTLSASSGTRCCTRSSTYMLECGYELRRTQNGRSRKGLWLQHGGQHCRHQCE